jgi:hypothetical protein
MGNDLFYQFSRIKQSTGSNKDAARDGFCLLCCLYDKVRARSPVCLDNRRFLREMLPE